jgi:hypothetical protein
MLTYPFIVDIGEAHVGWIYTIVRAFRVRKTRHQCNTYALETDSRRRFCSMVD